MALSLTSALVARQLTRDFTLNPAIGDTLKAFFKYWSSFRGNASLQYIPFIGTSADDAGGQVLADAACTLYFVYAKKTATATDAYLVIFDDATDDAGAGTDGRVVLPLLQASDENFFLAPTGVPMPTGVVAKSYTDFDGTTDTSAGDAPNGFVIIGA